MKKFVCRTCGSTFTSKKAECVLYKQIHYICPETGKIKHKDYKSKKNMEEIMTNSELDRLINDEEWAVRLSVAKQGYGLDKLVNDKNWKVRRAVAEQGYGLALLIKDENMYVREAAVETLKEYKDKNGRGLILT